MNRHYFVDTSTLIDWLNKDRIKTHQLKINPALNTLLKELEKENTNLYIDSMVVFEVLRRCKSQEQLDKYKQLLETQFKIIDIGVKEYNVALDFHTYCKLNKSTSLEYHDKIFYSKDGCKHKGKLIPNFIDFIHYAAAKVHNLDIIATDGDFKQIADICKDLVL